MTSEAKGSAESTSANAGDGISGTGKPARKKSFIRTLFRNWRLVGVLLLVLFAAGTYLWKGIAVKRAKAAVTERAAEVIGEQARANLRLAALPMVWAVRSEMMRGNMEQVGEYLNQFVKEPNMKELAVAAPDGRIVAATDKRREGAAAADAFPADVLKAEAITATSREDGSILVAAPIMGLNARLGTLVMVSSFPAFSLEKPVKQ